ncbi:tetratricopeptide repeat protein [Nocardia sp. NPDC050799]|uniref:tetratricopeptide repeat protein n=1 Tax=Nocardia sp. NPDC050799 TaxID=3154842 RepID=UPI0033F0DAD3
MQPPPEAFRPPAEVEAPPGIDNLEAWPGWFVGREPELARLDAALAGEGVPVVVAAVHGLGGVGKSSLAAYWAGTRDHGCAPMVWIHADSKQGVDRGLAGLAARLQPALAEVLTVQDLAERGLQWLSTHTGWLLILDNVEDPADIAPVLARARTGKVLITGRLSVPWQAGAVIVSLDVLAADEAQRLLTGLITAGGPRDLDGVAELCEALGYLPLAVEQAGAYLAHQRFTTPRAYLRLLTDHPAPTFDRAAAGTDPQRTIARVWRVTLDRIAELEPAAGELLRTLAWYAPDNIPLTLCWDPADQITVDAALGVLAAYNMITPDPGGAGLSIHRLVQAVARTPDADDPHRDPEAIQQARARAAATLHAGLPDIQNPATWPAWRNLLPHIDALTSYTPTSGSESTTATIATICNNTGIFLNDQGLHASALDYLHHARTDCERVLGDEHPDTLASRNNLALAHQSAGRVGEAIPLLERTLADRERILGEEHPNTLTSRNNLALAHRTANRVGEAIPLYERTLTDCERILGEEHPNTLTSRNNLAGAYRAAGRVGEAIPLYERNLTDAERILGPGHPTTGVARSNLAVVRERAR